MECLSHLDEASHWRYSSEDYEGTSGLLKIERFWQIGLEHTTWE